MFVLSIITAVISLLPLVYGLSYFTFVGALITMALVTECILIKMQQKMDWFGMNRQQHYKRSYPRNGSTAGNRPREQRYWQIRRSVYSLLRCSRSRLRIAQLRQSRNGSSQSRPGAGGADFGVNKRGDEILLETTQIKQRLPFIDLIRGITIIEMISYHFLWDLVYLYNADIPWYKSHGAYIWQQSICWTFILLAGFSWHLGKKHMKRGLWAFGGGVVVSLVTAIVLPNDRVRYGVLTLIGSCILIWILLDKVLKKIPAGVGVSVSFVLFLILRSWTKQDPIQLSDNLLNVTWWKSVLAYIGFPQAGFSSTDYFPLLPWIFLFATGYFLYSFLQEKGLINRLFGKWKVPGINFLGKHSLIIYMIHQPICYVVAFLVSEIF